MGGAGTKAITRLKAEGYRDTHRFCERSPHVATVNRLTGEHYPPRGNLYPWPTHLSAYQRAFSTSYNQRTKVVGCGPTDATGLQLVARCNAAHFEVQPRP
jgi:hypothetical protein